jgi:uncharacterized membrane protein
MQSIRRVGGPTKPKSEDAMKNLLSRAAAMLAASVTTLVMFSAVAGLADDDRAMLLAAKVKPTVVAEAGDGRIQR